MNKISGIAASAGIAVARAFILKHPDYTITKTGISDTEAEVAKLNDALAKSRVELQTIKERTLAELGRKRLRFSNHICLFLMTQS